MPALRIEFRLTNWKLQQTFFFPNKQIMGQNIQPTTNESQAVAYTRPAVTPTSLHRGLQNKEGENNCFLNVTIQALWHLGPFRVELQRLLLSPRGSSSSSSRGDFISTLSDLFIQYEFAEFSVLPPTRLRVLLGSISDRFQLGQIADANEVLDAILTRIHSESGGDCPGPNKCFAHKVFCGEVVEMSHCSDPSCGASSEPSLMSNFTQCVYVAEIVSEARKAFGSQLQENKQSKSSRPSVRGLPMNLRVPRFGIMSRLNERGSDAKKLFPVQPTVRLGDLLKTCLRNEKRSCPSLSTGVAGSSTSASRAKRTPEEEITLLDIENENVSFAGTAIPPLSLPQSVSGFKPKVPPIQFYCKAKASVEKHCLTPPLAVAITAVWTQAREDPDIIHDFLAIISYTIKLSDLFTTVGAATEHSNGKKEASYVFRGLVCYYGLHYVSIFQEYCPGEPRFLLFDDARIRPLGSWRDVKIECVKAMYQPVLLLYELEGGSSGISQPGIVPNYCYSPVVQSSSGPGAVAEPKFSFADDHLVSSHSRGARDQSFFLPTHLSRSISTDFVEDFDGDVTDDKADSFGDKRLPNSNNGSTPMLVKRSIQQDQKSGSSTNKSDSGEASAVSSSSRLSIQPTVSDVTFITADGTPVADVTSFSELGLELERNETGEYIVVHQRESPFKRTDIELMDKIVAINGHPLDLSENIDAQLRSSCGHHGHLILTVQSAYRRQIVARCQYCDNEIPITTEREEAVRAAYRIAQTKGDDLLIPLKCTECYGRCRFSVDELVSLIGKG